MTPGSQSVSTTRRGTPYQPGMAVDNDVATGGQEVTPNPPPAEAPVDKTKLELYKLRGTVFDRKFNALATLTLKGDVDNFLDHFKDCCEDSQSEIRKFQPNWTFASTEKAEVILTKLDQDLSKRFRDATATDKPKRKDYDFIVKWLGTVFHKPLVEFTYLQELVALSCYTEASYQARFASLCAKLETVLKDNDKLLALIYLKGVPDKAQQALIAYLVHHTDDITLAKMQELVSTYLKLYPPEANAAKTGGASQQKTRIPSTPSSNANTAGGSSGALSVAKELEKLKNGGYKALTYTDADGKQIVFTPAHLDYPLDSHDGRFRKWLLLNGMCTYCKREGHNEDRCRKKKKDLGQA